jgi:hypothetical protein
MFYRKVVQDQISLRALFTLAEIESLFQAVFQPRTLNVEYYNRRRKDVYHRYKTVYRRSKPSEVAQNFFKLQSNETPREFADNTNLGAVLEG